MTDVPYPDDMQRLEDNIRTEVNAQLGMAGLDLDRATVENLVAGVAANIDYAFEFRWRPRWVEDGDAHQWTEQPDAPRHFVECLECKRITEHPTAEDATARYSAHARTEHAQPAA